MSGNKIAGEVSCILSLTCPLFSKWQRCVWCWSYWLGSIDLIAEISTFEEWCEIEKDCSIRFSILRQKLQLIWPLMGLLHRADQMLECVRCFLNLWNNIDSKQNLDMTLAWWFFFKAWGSELPQGVARRMRLRSLRTNGHTRRRS